MTHLSWVYCTLPVSSARIKETCALLLTPAVTSEASPCLWLAQLVEQSSAGLKDNG